MRRWVFTDLYNFGAGPGNPNGYFPLYALTPATDGSYYGIANGGSSDQGVIYRLAADGTQTALYGFTGGTDGSSPSGAMILDDQGNLYGATRYGGDTDNGVIYKLTPDGTQSVLYSFPQSQSGGTEPRARLLRDDAGNLYGVADGGNSCGSRGCGVVFVLAPDGTYSVLHAFTGSDGSGPNGDLLQDSAGNLYGTTTGGGAYDEGVIFKLTLDGTFTTLHEFTGGSDGALPAAGMVGDEAGNLYGTAELGGIDNCGAVSCGVVFKLTPDGTYTVLYSFKGGFDGGVPSTQLYRDPDTGALYGTTDAGGFVPCAGGANVRCSGTVFVIRPDGSKKVLHSFNYQTGYKSFAVVKGHGPELVGVASSGGAYGWGAVYSLRFEP